MWERCTHSLDHTVDVVTRISLSRQETVRAGNHGLSTMRYADGRETISCHGYDEPVATVAHHPWHLHSGNQEREALPHEQGMASPLGYTPVHPLLGCSQGTMTPPPARVTQYPLPCPPVTHSPFGLVGSLDMTYCHV